MSSNESAAYEIMKSLDVDYVLIIFGGVIGYSGDDINKFLWMVRIAEGEHPKDIRVSVKMCTGPQTEAAQSRGCRGGSSAVSHHFDAFLNQQAALLHHVCFVRLHADFTVFSSKKVRTKCFLPDFRQTGE